MRKNLEEILHLARVLIRCDVLEEPVPEEKLCGLTAQELRSHSHRPQDYYGQTHFMPEVGDGERILRKKRMIMAPGEMETIKIGLEKLTGAEKITLKLED
jgi:ethanolamine utilization cobalamin adenosyltransferase